MSDIYDILSQNNSNIEVEIIEIKELLQKVFKSVSDYYYSNHLGFKVSLNTDYCQFTSQLKVIRYKFSRALYNIINNCFYALYEKTNQVPKIVDYSPALFLKTREIDGVIEIIIEDNGTGIDSTKIQNKDDIFLPFKTTKPDGKGTGLGLYLTAEIIRKWHEGSIEVESELGQFTRFIITLPVDSLTSTFQPLRKVNLEKF